MGVSGGRKKVVEAAVAIAACCLLIIIDSLPLRAVGQEDAPEEFWEQFLAPSATSSSSLTPMEKSVLARFLVEKGSTKDLKLKYGGIGAAAGGGLLALLAPMLRVKSTENYVRGALERPVEITIGEKASPPKAFVEPLPQKERLGVGKRLKRFFTPAKDADWPKRGSNAAAVAATAMILGGLGMIVAAHLKNRKMKKMRRKSPRPLYAQQQERSEVEEDCEFSPSRPECMAELMQRIEEARNPTGPLGVPPPPLFP